MNGFYFEVSSVFITEQEIVIRVFLDHGEARILQPHDAEMHVLQTAFSTFLAKAASLRFAPDARSCMIDFPSQLQTILFNV